VTLNQIIETSNRLRIETILHALLTFQFNRACFQRRSRRKLRC